MRAFITSLLLCSSLFVNAQFGAGFGAEINAYSRYVNPKMPNDSLERSAGQLGGFLPAFGPKVWLGNDKFALTLEGKINLKLYTVNIKFREYQGLGSISFPVMAKLNFRGKHLEKLGEYLHFYAGGGIQWTKTELYLRPEEYKDIDRPYFTTYVAELGFGIGPVGVNKCVFVRFGVGDKSTSTFNIGLSFNTDLIFLKKEMKEEPESDEAK
jgi:hypothetical protein